MAEEDAWKRRRKRELERDREEEEEKAARDAKDASTISRPNQQTNHSIEKLIQLLDRAEPMIEQLNSLYQQYVAGVERNPPNERRKILDQTMTNLQLIYKPTAAYVFRYNNIYSRYLTYRDRWDKMMKDLEDGKIKRVVQAKSGPQRF